MADPAQKAKAETFVSILVPAFNEEETVERAYREVTAVMEGLEDTRFEMIFTDNHSTDGTFRKLMEIAERDPRVKVIRFSRNCGYQRSLLVAYQSASGDCAIQLDCDLQDPPELIPQMLEKWREGHQVVYGIRRSLADGPLVAFARRAFYAVINWLSEDELPLNVGEFRLVDRRILNELARVRDSSPYLRGLIAAMGFSQVGLEYDRQDRIAGTSKFPFKAMLSLAIDGIVNHSLVPLRLATLVGMSVAVITFLMLVIYLIGKLVFGQDWPAGFATTTVLLLLSMMLNAMFFGIVGEYLGRIFMQAKAMHVPIVEARVNIDPPAHLTAPDADGPMPEYEIHAPGLHSERT
ncbi:glycosyltransferase family 2 protein [Oceanomicrobium pacificus]|uniref:Glycosyltransferase n=1 Tax=Oceanomicrobium pacificus TaxID=2692916 RepID=A0A6B0TTV1_9RHOB|nr:glycosyltransferase family 2 protein [Oceanomicrobium pacificus]MXU65225.1 glycosyltransferase [Oceanomicrobium pacificus]